MLGNPSRSSNRPSASAETSQASEPWHSPPAQRRLLGLERSLREAAEELARPRGLGLRVFQVFLGLSGVLRALMACRFLRAWGVFGRSGNDHGSATRRSARNLKGPEKNFKYIRPVNMKDPEDVRVSGMAADPPSRVEPDRLGDHHGISAIILQLCFTLCYLS